LHPSTRFFAAVFEHVVDEWSEAGIRSDIIDDAGIEVGYQILISG
jgi:hypothetical protein